MDPEKDKPPVNIYRAAREFERFMRKVDPTFDINAPGEERMTLGEYQEDQGRTLEQNAQIQPDNREDRLIAEIVYFPDQERIEVERVDHPTAATQEQNSK